MMMGTVFELGRIEREAKEAGCSEAEIERRKSEFLADMYEVHKDIAWWGTRFMVRSFLGTWFRSRF